MREDPENGSKSNEEEPQEGEEAEVGSCDSSQAQWGVSEAGKYVETGKANKSGEEESSSDLRRSSPELSARRVTSENKPKNRGTQNA